MRIETARSTTPWTLAVHGGAGNPARPLDDATRPGFRHGLTRAWQAGATVLENGGGALDAVCAAVRVLEDDPLFNAGHGAALTDDGHAELDAGVMCGDGRAGAVAGIRTARNPVLAARAVMEQTGHVLMAAPPPERVADWGLRPADEDYFVTAARQEQLRTLHRGHGHAPRHGTVGAVARDAHGLLAAATSTGGIAGQRPGRIGDTPLIGCGTYARDGCAAISCTGDGEAFIRGVVAHDIAARIRYARQPLPNAVTATFAEELTAHGASGGLVAVDASGATVVAYNSAHMFAAYHDGADLVVRA